MNPQNLRFGPLAMAPVGKSVVRYIQKGKRLGYNALLMAVKGEKRRKRMKSGSVVASEGSENEESHKKSVSEEFSRVKTVPFRPLLLKMCYDLLYVKMRWLCKS